LTGLATYSTDEREAVQSAVQKLSHDASSLKSLSSALNGHPLAGDKNEDIMAAYKLVHGSPGSERAEAVRAVCKAIRNLDHEVKVVHGENL